MEWQLAPELQRRVEKIIDSLQFYYIDARRVFVFRSYGSKSRAKARIWSLPKIWQKALNVRPAYCLEVLSEKFDDLSKDCQDRILIHELLHIPHNFSGSLLPHHSRKRVINRKIVEKLYRTMFKLKSI